MSEALKLFLNKNNMGHLYNDILAKFETIVQNETMMNDCCNAVIYIIDSNLFLSAILIDFAIKNY